MEGAGHTQVFFSLTLLRIKLALFSKTSLIMDSAADYYTENYPWGHLLPHPSLVELTVPGGSTMLHFCSWSERIRSTGSSSPWIRKCPFTHASRKIISPCSFLKCLRLSTCSVIPEQCSSFSSVTVTRCYSSLKVSTWNSKSLRENNLKNSEKETQTNKPKSQADSSFVSCSLKDVNHSKARPQYKTKFFTDVS